MSTDKQRPRVKPHTSTVAVHARVLADITGIPEWKARNVIKWRLMRALSVEIERVVDS